jgi:hypothetical protein
MGIKLEIKPRLYYDAQSTNHQDFKYCQSMSGRDPPTPTHTNCTSHCLHVGAHTTTYSVSDSFCYLLITRKAMWSCYLCFILAINYF